MAELSAASSSIHAARRHEGEEAVEGAARTAVTRGLDGLNPAPVSIPTVLIADDHRLFGEAMSSALSGHGMQVVGVVSSVREAIAEAAQAKPDLALLDLDLPDGDGVEAGRAIAAVSEHTVVLVVTARAQPATLHRTLAAGLHGLVTKDAPLSRFVAAVSAALAGQTVLPTDLARDMRPRTREDDHAALLRRTLTGREQEVLALLVDGTSTAQMVARLGVTQNTVRTHVGRVLTKLQAHSRLEAAAFALKHGLVESSGGRRPA
jgi:two-component system, NarL family, nitrate/nitrite response regulator NarL